MGKINTFDDIIKQLKGLENINVISGIFEDIKNENNNAEINIINCINKCTSPVKLNINDEDSDVKNKIQTIFRAFDLFPLSETRILIIGQDPYTEESSKADGCAFSVKNDKQDASLVNIFNAVVQYRKDKFNIVKKNDIKKWKYDLKTWAKDNNVLLLNSSLTHQCTDKKIIEEHRTGWESFINKIIIKLICSEKKLVVFLWGKSAQCTFFNAIQELGKIKPDKCNLMRKMILMTSHPSNTGGAVNLGFSEDAPNHFAACDEFLFGKNKSKYTWLNFPENNE